MVEGRKYDLGDRTFRFSQEVISLCSKIPKNQINNPIISQLVRAGTSIGANYAEADSASSTKDFINKITIAHKEASETKYWLKIVNEIASQHKDEIRKLSREVQELNLILATIVRNTRTKSP